jgi:AraC-like DNA-binding protein
MEGEPDRDLKGNFMVLVPPNVPHEFISTQRSLSVWAHFTCRALVTYDVFSLFTIPVVYRGKKATEIGKLCEELARPVTKSAVHPLLAACEHQANGLKLMKILLSEGRPIPSRDPTPEFGRIQPVLASLESDLGGPITRESMAAQANLSTSRFHTVFKKVTGEAPMQYVIRRRMDRARELLLGSSAPVSEVARAVGYPDQFHFSREFKHTFRISPVQYRRQKDRPETRDGTNFLQRWL